MFGIDQGILQQSTGVKYAAHQMPWAQPMTTARQICRKWCSRRLPASGYSTVLPFSPRKAATLQQFMGDSKGDRQHPVLKLYGPRYFLHRCNRPLFHNNTGQFPQPPGRACYPPTLVFTWQHHVPEVTPHVLDATPHVPYTSPHVPDACLHVPDTSPHVSDASPHVSNTSLQVSALPCRRLETTTTMAQHAMTSR